MAITVVVGTRVNGPFNGVGNPGTSPYTFPTPPVVGDHVVVISGIEQNYGAAIDNFGCTDTYSNSYDVQPAFGQSAGCAISIAYVANTGAGFTVNPTASSVGSEDVALDSIVLKVSGLNNSSLNDLRVSLNEQTAYLTSFNINTAATDTAEELVIVVAAPAALQSGNAITAPSGFTTLYATTGSRAGVAYYRVTSAAGSQAFNLSGFPISGSPSLVYRSFRAAGAPPPPPPPPSSPSGPYQYLGASASTGTFSGSTTGSTSITYAGGESVIVTLSAWGSGGIVSPVVTDGTHTYTYINTWGAHQSLFYCHGVTAGTYTLSFSCTSGLIGSFRAYKFSGLLNLPPIVSTGQTFGGSNAAGPDNVPVGSPNVTTVPALLFAVCRKQTDDTNVSAGTGFTLIPDRLLHEPTPGNINGGAMHRRITSTGVVATAFTVSPDAGFQEYQNAVVAFAEAPSFTGREDVLLGGGPLGQGPLGTALRRIAAAPPPAALDYHAHILNLNDQVFMDLGGACITNKGELKFYI